MHEEIRRRQLNLKKSLSRVPLTATISLARRIYSAGWCVGRRRSDILQLIKPVASRES